MNKPRVLVAMSGGVDSSVAAALLVERGYEVVGATMRLWSPEGEIPDWYHGCCSLGAVEDARRVCDRLGVRHYVFNVRKEFYRRVVENFLDEYAAGRTPNPCIRCNEFIKFGVFLRKAKLLNMDFVATGHHARIERAEGGYRLLAGRDEAKDQSYFLYAFTQEQMAHTLLPVGDLTKAQVREIARDLGLATADKPESQEVCFLMGQGLREFVAARRPCAGAAGEIVDSSGRALGFHSGIAGYTVGQRRGIGLAHPEPLYVRAIDASSNRLVVGTAAEVRVGEFRVSGLNWIPGPPEGSGIRGQAIPLSPRERDRVRAVPGAHNPSPHPAFGWVPASPGGRGGSGDPASGIRHRASVDCTVKIRYRNPGIPAAVELDGHDSAIIRLHRPVAGVAPGQAAVFYQGDRVLGGGVIDRAFGAMTNDRMTE